MTDEELMERTAKLFVKCMNEIRKMAKDESDADWCEYLCLQLLAGKMIKDHGEERYIEMVDEAINNARGVPVKKFTRLTLIKS